MILITWIEYLDGKIMAVDWTNLDFTALRTLRLVHEHGSFSRAAEALGLAQSTVSYTVSRLRDAFDDPLFVRLGHEVVPTARCTELVTEASALLDRFEALAAPQKFEPSTAEVEIVISCNYYERVTIIPELARILRDQAPGMRLKIISSTIHGKTQLTRSETDLLIGPIQIHDTGYYKRSLFPEKYVCILDPANPLAGKPLDVATFVAAPQVIVNYGGNFRSQFLTEMDAAGHRPNAVMEVPSPANLESILSGTDMIATVPARIAETFRGVVASVPCPFPASFPIDMFWTARTHASAPHVWLRAQIALVSQQAAQMTSL
jgi:DNA-binding transcriptional LysR family regulator